jgi:hypothetical protein
MMDRVKEGRKDGKGKTTGIKMREGGQREGGSEGKSEGRTETKGPSKSRRGIEERVKELRRE